MIKYENFSKLLNAYMELLNCTAQQLADASGLSGSMISRYRSGEREPSYHSESAEKLIRGLVTLAGERSVADLNEERIRREMQAVLVSESIDYTLFAERFDELINSLDISLVKLSAFLTYDSSFLSRVRSGKRRPADAKAFSGKVADYLVLDCASAKERSRLAMLLERDPRESLSDEELREQVVSWLCHEMPNTYLRGGVHWRVILCPGWMISIWRNTPAAFILTS